jgi:hypothetical protein
MNLHARPGLAAGILAIGLLGPAAAHAGVPVNLRIEGSKSTVFEGRVNVPVRKFRFTNQKARHVCDGTAALGGPAKKPLATRGGAIDEAAERFGFSLKGTWNDSFGATFTRVGGQNVAYDPVTKDYLAEYADDAFAQLGACADVVHRDENVLFAYGDGSEPLLQLSGPTRTTPGTTTPVHVMDVNGAPIAGALVGTAVTGADGSATAGPFTAGWHALKATKPGTIRSNGLRLCVTTGADHACPPVIRITDIQDGARFSRHSAPRRFRGVIEAKPFGLKAIRLRLIRAHRGHTTIRPFKVARSSDWSRRLPSRLGPGQYKLIATAFDRNGGKGRSLVVFTVR